MLACCASASFARAIADGRPYPDPAACSDAVDAAFKALSWDDIVESMNAHPRIGDRVASGGWSAAEQSGAAAASDRGSAGAGRRQRSPTSERFGHVFLICASGLSGQEMLDQLRARLGNDQDAERAVVREELREDNPAADDEAAGPVTDRAATPMYARRRRPGRPAAGVQVRLEHLGRGGWAPAGQGRTGPDEAGGVRRGRPGPTTAPAGPAGFEPGVYRITFGSGAYFGARGSASFYPEVTITFEMTSRASTTTCRCC